jgi:uncharacterized protein (TIGR03435 family)
MRAIAMRARSTRSKSVLRTSVAAASIVLLHAQPAFEVASIKPNVSGAANRTIRPSPGRLSIFNMTVKDLAKFAYQVKDFEISGGPGWIDADQYDIEANAEGDPSSDQMRAMLQALLQDRFKLALHRETKDVPIYALTVAKSGFRLRASEAGKCTPPELDPRLPGQSQSNFCGSLGAPAAESTEVKVRTLRIAAVLSMILGRPVADRTGITGVFPVHLKYSSEELGEAGSPAPSIFTAVQEQLGLKLESTRGPVEVLVIDRAERPSEN